MMHVSHATDRTAWEEFLQAQRFAPFLQSWTMGDVFAAIGQEPLRLEMRENGRLLAVCQAIVVPARRGRHLMVQYGPVLSAECRMRDGAGALRSIVHALSDEASKHGCSFIRMSPFWVECDPLLAPLEALGALSSPMHLLSEYTWYIPLRTTDRWADADAAAHSEPRSEDAIRADMRKTTRNLIGRAEREGVTVEASRQPLEDLEIYFALEEETYKRHGFVPYRHSFVRAQVQHFAPLDQAIVYVARYRGEPVAASVHMTYGGATSYHHGASTHRFAKIPSSYLLQWTAIIDAGVRGDDIYNFWGIAPRVINDAGEQVIVHPKHPFAGVTTFKTGFGGKPLPLAHCMDIPLSATYRLTRAFEFARKWKRGF